MQPRSRTAGEVSPTATSLRRASTAGISTVRFRRSRSSPKTRYRYRLPCWPPRPLRWRPSVASVGGRRDLRDVAVAGRDHRHPERLRFENRGGHTALADALAIDDAGMQEHAGRHELAQIIVVVEEAEQAGDGAAQLEAQRPQCGGALPDPASRAIPMEGPCQRAWNDLPDRRRPRSPRQADRPEPPQVRKVQGDERLLLRTCRAWSSFRRPRMRDPNGRRRAWA